MGDKPFKPLLVAAFLTLMTPLGGHAAGLGRLTVFSTLGQPLNAEVELLAVQKGETITARLATPEVYQQANAQFNNALTGTRVTVERRPNGQAYLKATSPRAISEPFIELLIEINSEHGRVLRQYTALLDPPGYGRAAGEIPPPAVTSAPQSRAPAPPAPSPALVPPPTTAASAEAPEASAPAPAPARRPSRGSGAAAAGAGAPAGAAPAPAASGARQYGPVKPGETLGRIARHVKPEGVSLEQTLVGLYRQNPDAFIQKNMNLVKSGRILTVPESNELAAVAQPQARQEVRMHVADFNAYRGRVADNVATASETGSVRSGRIGSRVADAAAGEGPRDTVRLSRGEAKGKGKGAGGDRVRALEEEAIARDKALTEANTRIAQLEQIIKDSQRAAELKGGPAAGPKGAEKAADKAGAAPAVAIPPPPGKPAVDTAKGGAGDAPKGAPADAGKAAPTDLATGAPADAGKGAPTVTAEAPAAPPAGDAAPAPKPEAAAATRPKKGPEPVTAPEIDIVETITSEPMYLAAAGAVVLLGGLGFMVARRRRTAGRASDSSDDLVKIAPSLSGGTAAAGGAAPFSPSSGPAEPKATTPAARPEPLVPAPAPTPTPRASPLTPAPAPAASAAKPSAAPVITPAKTEPVRPAATTGATKPGSQADDNDLDFNLGITRPSSPDSAPPRSSPSSLASATSLPELTPEPLKADPEAPRPDPMRMAEPPRPLDPPPRPPQPSSPLVDEAPRPVERAPSRAADVLRAAQAQRAAEVKPLEPLMPDFALDDAGVSPASRPKVESAVPAKDPNLLDFDLEPLPPINEPLGMDKVSTEPPASVDFKLDLADLDMGSTSSQRSTSTPARDDHWYDVQQKFDLAKAYEEMGDKAGAKDILEEVLREGDSEQKDQAKKLLGSIS